MQTIDVKYAHCWYHTRIGLGKWKHDLTLDKRHRELKICSSKQDMCAKHLMLTVPLYTHPLGPQPRPFGGTNCK